MNVDNNNNNNNNNIKKKRGRPRKYKKEEKKVLKKRGRKKKNEKIVCDKENLIKIEQNTLKIINKSIIIHLPINIKSYEEKNNNIYENKFYNYDSNINLDEPIGFDLTKDTLMDLEEETIEQNINKDVEIKEYKIIDNDKIIMKKVHKIMIEYENFKGKKFFATDICCWHCCHKFTTMPCGIPLYYEDNIFYVKGIFCSFNCVLRNNYNSKENENIIQERESLLYLMYKKINNIKEEVYIPYAPEKEVLKIFGGLLEIEEFRKNTKTYEMVYPPILSIIPQLEEINILDNKNDKLILNISKKSKLKKKNTLDNLFK
jgi:hypothetical protein